LIDLASMKIRLTLGSWSFFPGGRSPAPAAAHQVPAGFDIHIQEHLVRTESYSRKINYVIARWIAANDPPYSARFASGLFGPRRSVVPFASVWRSNQLSMSAIYLTVITAAYKYLCMHIQRSPDGW